MQTVSGTKVLITLVISQQDSCHQADAGKWYLTLTGSDPIVRDCKQISNLYNTDLAIRRKTSSLIFKQYDKYLKSRFFFFFFAVIHQSVLNQDGHFLK